MAFVAMFDSRQAAEMLKQRHSDTLRRIDNLYCSNEFRAENYQESTYKDKLGRERRMVFISKYGMMFLLMESGHRKSTAFKIHLLECLHKVERLFVV